MQIVVNIKSKYQVFCLFDFQIKNSLQLRSQLQTLSNTVFWNCSVIYIDLLQEARSIYINKHCAAVMNPRSQRIFSL